MLRIKHGSPGRVTNAPAFILRQMTLQGTLSDWHFTGATLTVLIDYYGATQGAGRLLRKPSQLRSANEDLVGLSKSREGEKWTEAQHTWITNTVDCGALPGTWEKEGVGSQVRLWSSKQEAGLVIDSEVEDRVDQVSGMSLASLGQAKFWEIYQILEFPVEMNNWLWVWGLCLWITQVSMPACS